MEGWRGEGGTHDARSSVVGEGWGGVGQLVGLGKRGCLILHICWGDRGMDSVPHLDAEVGMFIHVHPK